MRILLALALIAIGCGSSAPEWGDTPSSGGSDSGVGGDAPASAGKSDSAAASSNASGGSRAGESDRAGASGSNTQSVAGTAGETSRAGTGAGGSGGSFTSAGGMPVAQAGAANAGAATESDGQAGAAEVAEGGAGGAGGVSDTPTDCVCSAGACCDGCHFLPKSHFCGEVVRSARCTTPDSLRIEKDYWNLFCSGDSTECTRWAIHTKYVDSECAAGSVCTGEAGASACAAN